MAAPATLTTLDLSGTWIINKSLSNTTEMDKILQLQGVSWLKRTAISAATITLSVKHYKDDAGVEHIDIDQTLTGGIKGTTENRTMDWEFREHADHLFGPVKGKSRRLVNLDELEHAWHKEGWTPDTAEHGVIESYVESDTPKSKTTWVGHQTWGFQEIDGVRRYTRHIKFTGPKGEDVQALMVYDYVSA
ncbi:hypothetical protein EXIGLDRAFT_736291 [Exidia glandulosa HHB12029]|uniref:LCCL domain-containing protein n=1 Tax=Exidia glandulosa HHB12029 TaxID=1314781 RepID=A0A165JIC6_EXIGL|nr:hypothetical protein EXIGLDRAFT_736291 [Exidia glandulosa HHB12029]